MNYRETLDRFRGPGSSTGVKALADALGVSRSAVHAWERNGIPLLRQYQIKELLASREAVDRFMDPQAGTESADTPPEYPEACRRCGRITLHPADGLCERCQEVKK